MKYIYEKIQSSLSNSNEKVLKWKNLYACLGAACMLLSYLMFLTSIMEFIAFHNLWEIAPILLFVAITLAYVIGNATYALCVIVYDKLDYKKRGE